MQKELAAFLKRCPGGVVALDNAQKLHPALLPVFINALSEQGSFEVPPLPCLDLFSSIGICCALPLQPGASQDKVKSLKPVPHRLCAFYCYLLRGSLSWAGPLSSNLAL